MRRFLSRVALVLAPVVLCCVGLSGLVALAPQEPDASPAAEAEDSEQSDLTWPRVIEEGDTTFTVYQPQIDRFDSAVLDARAAVQVETKTENNKKHTSYGVIWIHANATIDKENKLVQLDDIQITKANFPTAGDQADRYLEILRSNAEGTRTVSLARIEANLAVTQADKKGNAVALKNDPPKIYYRTVPALLVLIDGEPALRPVEGAAGIERVINTRALILKSGDAFYMPIADRWVAADAPTGPWRFAASVPPPVQGIRDAVAKDENQSQVDLMDETSDDVKGVLASGTAPDIIVSTVPAELIVTQGDPQMKPVTGTQLLYVTNTSGDILFDLQGQDYYVPLTGRWFRSKSLEGPWQFVEGDALPKDFANIPANDPKSSVLASVPGTPAAQEAVIANDIPQTAEVDREEAKYESEYDGDPKWEDVPDTPLQYAVNSPTPVVRVGASSYYAVRSGVWFSASAAVGPWVVATAVPPVIYSIPAVSPIHYVTYVRIYRYSPTIVWVGYTPGYLGTCYSRWGTVVFGTGWYYRPWIGRYWYGSPWTWGFGAGFYWSARTGWGWGFGWGGYRPYYSPWWGPYYGWRARPPYYARPVHGGPVSYPAYRHPRNWNAMNIYNRPNRPLPGVRPAVVRPITPPGRPAVVRPAPGTGRPSTQPAPGTGRPSTRPAQPGRPSTQPVPGATAPARPEGRPVTRPSRPDNVYAGPDGNVYRPAPGRPGNWETNDRGQWKPVAPTRPMPQQPSTRPAPPARPSVDERTINQLSREQRGRQAGDARMRPSAPPRQVAPSRGAPPKPRQP